MMPEKPVYRHELKYMINKCDLLTLRAILSQSAKSDSHGAYTLRSLYFDDAWRSAYCEKLDGTYSRRKYRIRIYDYKASVIKLECKQKAGSFIYKRDARLSPAEYQSIINGECGFLLARSESVCRDFYAAYVCRALRPRIIVDYEREAYVLDEGTVRITLDSSVRAAFGGGKQDIFCRNLPCIPAIEPEKSILEVKYTEFLPDKIQNSLCIKSSEYIAASKYIMCCDAAKIV